MEEMSPYKISPNSSNYLDPEYYIFDDWRVKITLFVTYSIVFFFCTFGNLLVVLVMTLHWKMRSISKFCIANLAWANLCVGVFCIYQNLTMFIIDSWIFGSFFCKMYHFITSVSSTASTLILVVISVERYLVILHPFKCRQILTIKRLRWIIFGVWLSSGILCLPKLLYVMLIHHRKLTRSGDSNGTEVICTMNPNLFSSEVAELLQFILLFILPLSIISFLYYKVGVTLRQREAFSEAFVSASIFEYEPRQLSNNRAHLRAINPNSCCLNKAKEKEPLVTVPLQSISSFQGGNETIPQTKAIRSNICENCQKHWNIHKRKARGCSHASGNKQPTHVLRNVWGEDCFPSEENIFQSIPPESIPCSSKLIRINFSGSAVCCHDCGFFCRHTKISSTHRSHKDVVKLLAIIVATFTLCNLPFHLRKIYQNYFYRPENESDWDELATPITFLLTYVNCAINPIVYAFMSQNFRLCLCDLVRCKLRKPPRGSHVGKIL